MAADKKMKLGMSLRGLGYHLAAWRHPDVNPAGATTFEFFLKSAKIAEAAKFDMVFFADWNCVKQNDQPKGAMERASQNVELEPITLLSALAARTSGIGLVATASTTYNEPYHVARKFASLDHISSGRAAWNVVTSWSDEEAWNFNRDHHLEYDARYERAAEFVKVVTGLWNSWEDDAFLRNKKSGIYFNSKKLHVLDHVGKHFKVRGPLNIARTPQGRPLICQAGDSGPGRDIGAEFADFVYTANLDIDVAKTYYASLKDRAESFGRRRDSVKVLPAVCPYIGRTRQEAQDSLDSLQELIDPLIGLQQIYRQLGDMSEYPLDGPVPPPVNPDMRSDAKRLYAMAQRESLTIRQLYERVAAASSIRTLVGTAQDIADEFEHWFREGAADGFNVCPAMAPHVQTISDLLIPELQRRGLFRREYEGSTFRENVGADPQPFQIN